MSTWTIEARDPLVFRDGRPNDGRSASVCLPFPFPQTLAGVARTRLGSEPGRGFTLTDEEVKALFGVAIRGPMLVRGDRFYVPRPADVLAARAEDGPLTLTALRPLPGTEGVAFDEGLAGGLLPVGLTADESARPELAGKPPRSLAGYWSWPAFEAWLSRCGPTPAEAEDDGLQGPQLETRLHVALDETTGTYVDGALFSTSGLRFSTPEWSDLALWIDVDESSLPGRRIAPGPGPLGGERRLGEWVAAVANLPGAPAVVRERLASQDARVRVRAILATPGVFEAGALPSATGPLLAPADCLSVTLMAAAVGRPLTTSGWDFATSKPKPSRRLAPAGSVYWLDLEGAPEARLSWLDRVWASNVSDGTQDRRDGFGLAFVGVE
jgi:CRISPR-associated protein Cmr3